MGAYPSHRRVQVEKTTRYRLMIRSCPPPESTPVVAKVIDVMDCLGANIFEHVKQAGFARGQRAIVIAVRIWHAPANTAGPELIKVAVGPAHGSLDHIVQTVEFDLQWWRNCGSSRRHWERASAFPLGQCRNGVAQSLLYRCRDLVLERGRVSRQ